MSPEYENRSEHDALPADVSEALGEAHTGAALSPQSELRLRREILARVAEDRSVKRGFLTIRADEGEWLSIAPGIRKKSLYTDTVAGTESYLLKVEPGVQAPDHGHRGTELCLVLEGSVRYGPLHLSAGDWHVAHRESVHPKSFTDTGALLFIQEPLENSIAAP